MQQRNWIGEDNAKTNRCEEMMSLKNDARELKDLADKYPFDPDNPNPERHRRYLNLGSCGFVIDFGKINQAYLLSIGNLTETPHDIPDHIIEWVRIAFFGDRNGGTPIPPMSGINKIQFVKFH